MNTVTPQALSRVPDNKNTALENKFKFTILKLPHVEYFTRGVLLPSFSINTLEQPTVFMSYPRPRK